MEIRGMASRPSHPQRQTGALPAADPGCACRFCVSDAVIQIQVCSALHSRYAAFTDGLIPALSAILLPNVRPTHPPIAIYHFQGLSL